MMFTEKRHSCNLPPTPKLTYDVSRVKNRYVRLPLPWVYIHIRKDRNRAGGGVVLYIRGNLSLIK
jgi:hypothetical protein